MTSAVPVPGVAVELRGLSRVYAATGVVAVAPMDLGVNAGEFFAMLGPSGCGKSTLLRLIAGLDRPTTGQVHVGGQPAAAASRRQRAAYVFQDAHLLPWRTVRANVELPLELLGVGSAERRSRSAVMLEQVGLGEALTRHPNQLSGGMRMRVSMARALVTEPDLLLLDEPFAALDEITRHHLDEQLRQLWLARGMTVIFVTHSIEEACFLADRAVVLSQRPARIVLDHRLGLPAERMGELRTQVRFAEQMAVLFSALEAGMARP